MKRLTIIFASVLIASLLVTVLVRAATVYRDSVSGFQSASAESDGVNILLNAEGNLPGANNVSLRRDGNKVISGSWTLTVFPPDAAATASEKGKLTGSVTGGTLTFNGEGSLVRADSIQLTIQSGTGQYARVESGSATINLMSSAENPSRLTGTLILNF